MLLRSSKSILNKELIWYDNMKDCTEDMEEEELVIITSHTEDGSIIFKKEIVFITLTPLVTYLTLEEFNKLGISEQFTMKNI